MALPPLITICGTTGVGKSKLAIELALHLFKVQYNGWKGARIINADAMQVYRGLDILTNKVPVTEQQGVEHLLMGFKNPGEQYIVGQWVQDATSIVKETHQRRQIPIVVGGTSYWIQHLIFPNRLVSSGRDSFDPLPDTDAVQMSDKLAEIISRMPADLFQQLQCLPDHPPSASIDPEAAFALHRLLAILDPSLASRWHWRDTRKVLRNLHIIKETGKQASEILREQSQIGTNPKYRTLCLWIYADPSALNPRLDARVDDMIQQGLLGEVSTLRDIASASFPQSRDTESSMSDGPPPILDFTQGIYQSIGFRELHVYSTSVAPSEASFNDAVQRMKLSTRQYAKRQISWLRNKLLPAVHAVNLGQPLIAMYLLDGTNFETWNSDVLETAQSILQKFLNQEPLPDPLSLSEVARSMMTIKDRPTSPTLALNRTKVICPVCTVDTDQPIMIDVAHEWDAHQNTRRHRRLTKKLARKAINAAEKHVSPDDSS